MRRTLPLLLLALAASARAAALGPEWRYIRQAERDIDNGDFLKAEAQLTNALNANHAEPKIYEDKALVNIALDELPLARSNFKQAIAISKKKSLKVAKGAKGAKARQAWHRYVGELYCGIVEVTVLENEKALRSGLLGKASSKKHFQQALGRVREAMAPVYPYGKFVSRVDDPLIAKAVAAAGKPPLRVAKAQSKDGEEAAPEEEEPAPKPRKPSKTRIKKAAADEESAAEPQPDMGQDGGGADKGAGRIRAGAKESTDEQEMAPMSPIGGGGGGGGEAAEGDAGGGGGDEGGGGGDADSGGDSKDSGE